MNKIRRKKSFSGLRALVRNLGPSPLDQETAILGRLRRGERIEHFETVRQHKDGSLVDVSVSISPIRDARGRIVGASKIARDVGVRKRAQAAFCGTKASLREYTRSRDA